MASSLFIVWRESIEALLVIGILYNWLKRQNLHNYIKYLWLGSALGVIAAISLAIIFYIAANWYAGAGGEWMFTTFMAICAFFILHMVVWMHHSAQSMKKNIETKAESQIAKSQHWGITIIALLAVAREGSETVVFLSGIGSQQSGSHLFGFWFGAVIGLILAFVSFFLLQKFANKISWKYFFRISEILLITIGGALLVASCDKAIGQISQYDISDSIYNFLATPIWNSSFLISDNSTLTQLTGYHATPSMLQISSLAFYWGLAIILCYGKEIINPMKKGH